MKSGMCTFCASSSSATEAAMISSAVLPSAAFLERSIAAVKWARSRSLSSHSVHARITLPCAAYRSTNFVTHSRMVSRPSSSALTGPSEAPSASISDMVSRASALNRSSLLEKYR